MGRRLAKSVMFAGSVLPLLAILLLLLLSPLVYDALSFVCRRGT